MDEGRHAENSPFYRSRSAVALTITVSRKNRIKSETTLLEERFILHSCPTIANTDFQTLKHGGMLNKRLESWPDACSE